MTDSWLRRHNLEITEAHKIASCAKTTPRRILTEVARIELGFSHKTKDSDLWDTIWTAWIKFNQKFPS